jgi:threonine dehydrogenase-like Zn-dependent dehydrogenase
MKAVTANFSLGREVWDRFRSKLLSPRNRFHGLSLDLIEMPEPRLVSSQWVKVRTATSAISDMDEGMILSGDPSAFGAFLSFPFVPGNENLGIVTEIGEDVRGIEPGERVVIDPLLSCERRGVEPLCPSCSRGNPSGCRNFAEGVLGPGMMIGGCKDTSGGWGDSFIAHRSQVRSIPNTMESDQAILLPAFARALRAVLQHPPAPGDRVIVVGGGSLGLLTLWALQLLGHTRGIALVAEHPFQAEIAQKLGPSDLVTGQAPRTTYEEIAAFVGGSVRYPEVGRIALLGGADLVYETTGYPGSVEHAISFTGEGKKLVLMGINRTSGFDPTPLLFKGIHVSGTAFSGTERFNGQITSTFDVALDLASRHGVPHQEIITHKFRLEEHQKAFNTLADPSVSKAVKVVFQHVF